MKNNIVYTTANLAEYFLAHRRKWEEFYPSEHWVFERINEQEGGFGRVLDVGCAVGGLGNALTERFTISSYYGMDINAQAIDIAKRTSALPVPSQFVCADIVSCDEVRDGSFDTVVALSVADWNVDTFGIIDACWRKVAPGGRLVISLRLTDQASSLSIEDSYQFIVPSADRALPQDTTGLERAPYVVLNGREMLSCFESLSPKPSDILAYGYWGKPSATARTPFDRLVFSVLAVTRPENDGENAETRLENHLPAEVFL